MSFKGMAEENRQSPPGIAAVLSFVFSGLGQLYNGEIFRGLVIIFLSSLGMLAVVVGAILLYFCFKGVFSGRLQVLGIALFATGLLCVAIVGIYSITDAYKVACRK
jgi:TM2 domain-containing membrane protein YozV